MIHLAAALILAWNPTACRAVVSSPTGDVTWYGPTQRIADARARWYADPSWRRPENIPLLGYGRP